MLKQLRESKSLTRREVSVAVSLTENTLINVERNPLSARGTTLIALADYYGVTIDYLLGREEN